MIIVGLTGTIGSGKSTVADFLAEQVEHSGHWESWQLIAEIATVLRTSGTAYPKPDDLEAINDWLRPLSAALQVATGRTVPLSDIEITTERLQQHPEHYQKLFEHLERMQREPDLQTVALTTDTKEALRSLLQWLGGFLIVITDDGLWYDEILRRITAQTNLELATIGGVRFPGESRRIQQAGGSVVRIERPAIAKRDTADLTERQNDQIIVSSTLINDGDLQQLQHCTTKLLADLRHKELAVNYQATSF